MVQIRKDDKHILFKICLSHELDSFLQSMGSKMKAAREKNGITQREAAHLLGINYRHFQDIEAGKVNLKSECLLKILRFIANSEIDKNCDDNC